MNKIFGKLKKNILCAPNALTVVLSIFVLLFSFTSVLAADPPQYTIVLPNIPSGRSYANYPNINRLIGPTLETVPPIIMGSPGQAGIYNGDISGTTPLFVGPSADKLAVPFSGSSPEKVWESAEKAIANSKTLGEVVEANAKPATQPANEPPLQKPVVPASQSASNPKNTKFCGYPAIGMSMDIGNMYGEEAVAALNDPRMTFSEVKAVLGITEAKRREVLTRAEGVIKLWEVDKPIPKRLASAINDTLKTDYEFNEPTMKESELNFKQRENSTKGGAIQDGSRGPTVTMNSDKAKLLNSAKNHLNGENGQHISNEEALKLQSTNPNLIIHDPGAKQHAEAINKGNEKSGSLFDVAYTPEGGKLTISPGVFPTKQMIMGEDTGVAKVFEGSKPTKGMVDENCSIRKPTPEELKGMGFGAPSNGSLSGLGGGAPESVGGGGGGGSGGMMEALTSLAKSITDMAKSGGGQQGSGSGKSNTDKPTDSETAKPDTNSNFMTDISKIIRDALSLAIPEPQLQSVITSISESVAKLIKNGIPINNVP